MKANKAKATKATRDNATMTTDTAETLTAIADLRAAGVDLVTLGQYLRPTPKHAPVDRYVTPDAFVKYAEVATKLGFAYVASSPLVRSSYKAAEVFVRSILRPGDPAAADRLLKERLVEAQAAAARALTMSEMTARSAASLIPAHGLVRRTPAT